MQVRRTAIMARIFQILTLNEKTFLSFCSVHHSVERLCIVCDVLPSFVVRIEKKIMWVEERVIKF